MKIKSNKANRLIYLNASGIIKLRFEKSVKGMSFPIWMEIKLIAIYQNPNYKSSIFNVEWKKEDKLNKMYGKKIENLYIGTWFMNFQNRRVIWENSQTGKSLKWIIVFTHSWINSLNFMSFFLHSYQKRIYRIINFYSIHIIKDGIFTIINYNYLNNVHNSSFFLWKSQDLLNFIQINPIKKDQQ